MKKLIPLEKRSKKEQRAWYARQRGDWNGVNPVTRIVPNKKHYDRKKRAVSDETAPFLCRAQVHTRIAPRLTRPGGKDCRNAGGTGWE